MQQMCCIQFAFQVQHTKALQNANVLSLLVHFLKILEFCPCLYFPKFLQYDRENLINFAIFWNKICLCIQGLLFLSRQHRSSRERSTFDSILLLPECILSHLSRNDLHLLSFQGPSGAMEVVFSEQSAR